VHATALQLAYEDSIEVICVQEPWVSNDLEDQRTQVHPGYNVFTPISTWDTRPRAMTYVRKGLNASQKALEDKEHPDVCSVVLQTSHGPLDVVNIYNAGPGSERTNEAVERLMEYQGRGNGVICGDFNLHHSHWDPNARGDDAMAERLIDWVVDHPVVLLTDPTVPTREEAVIDLTLATSQLRSKTGVEARVDDRYNCGSDHEPILVQIENGRARQAGGGKGSFNMEKLDQTRFNASCTRGAAGLAWNPNAEIEERHQAVNRLAEDIQNVLILALQESTTRSTGKGTGQRWWDAECARAVAEHRTARKQWKRHKRCEAREPELRSKRNDSKRELVKAVKKAKESFYRKVVEELTDAKLLFQAVKWTQKRQKFNTPPLKGPDNNSVTDTQDKIRLLIQTHVLRDNTQDLPAPQFPEAETFQWSPLKTDEVKRAIFKPRSTAPGTDEVPNAALKMAWPYLGEAITALYNMSLDWGVYPDSFKKAGLRVVPKLGDRVWSDPKSYRLISLLPTLGKGLERTIATRLAYEAVEKEVIPRNYVCATPKRSATDLMLNLVEEIEDTVLDSKETASLATFDVKGAFDAVRPNRMVWRLVDQGWPGKVCQWVHSFLSGRYADLTLDGLTGEVVPLGGSLPQGSPISPILYMLFMAPLYRRGAHLRGYADDGLVIVAGRLPRDNIARLQRELYEIKAWCNTNGLELDMGKAGLIHITRGRTADNPSVPLPDGGQLDAKEPKKALKWLGVRFDRKLTYKAHVKEACCKASKVANGLRILAGCYKGAPADSLLKAVKACVLPVLTYGFQAWWPTPQGRRVASIAAKLDIVVRRAVRMALPVYSTTPTYLLMHAAGTPHMEAVLDDLMHGEAIRMSTLDPAHILSSSRIGGKADRIRNMLPKPIRPIGYLRYRGPRPPPPLDEPLGKEDEAKKHEERRRMSPITDLWAYSDGSMNKAGSTGAGWAVYRGDALLVEGRKSCGKWLEVADAEAEAALEAVKAAHEHAPPGSTSLWLCTDNKSVLQNINTETDRTGTSQQSVDEIRRLLCSWAHWGDAQAWWVPGHTDVQGNERADRLAKDGAELAHTQEDRWMTLARAKRWRKEWLRANFEDWWKKQKKPEHLRRQLEAPRPWKHRQYKNLCRKCVGRVLAARSAHGDFAEYHERLGHDDAELACQCGKRKSPLHPWTCRRRSTRLSESFVIKLLPTKNGLAHLAKTLHKKER
jgi:ribonuclease HI/exonuclease III